VLGLFHLMPDDKHKQRNNNNYTTNCYIFEPFAVETMGVFNASARHLLDDLGRRISENTGEAPTDQLPAPKDFDFGEALQCCPFA